MAHKLSYKLLSENAYPPVRGTPDAAGYDLRSAHDCVVPKYGKQLIVTDLAIRVPDNCYGRIAPRSGLALKSFINVGGGVIDRDYRGNVCVLLFNHSNKDFVVKRGDRIAQLICEVIVNPTLERVISLEETERGEAGFGSTDGEGERTPQHDDVGDERSTEL